MKFLYLICFILSLAITSKAQYSTHENIGFYPTAFNLKAGEKKFTNTDLIYNSYSQGISNNFSFNTGVLLLYDYNLVTAKVKYTHQINDIVHIGVSPMLLYYTEKSYCYYCRDDSYRHNLVPQLTGMMTIGSPSRFINLTYTSGFSMELKNREEQNGTGDFYGFGHITIGGSINVTKRISLISEFSIDVKDSYIPPSISARFVLKEKHVIQTGVLLIPLDGIAIPLLSYSYHWGLRR